jgi:hypothetical protein
MKAIRVKQIKDTAHGSNTNFIVKETNKYYEWYKNSPEIFECKEFEIREK